VDIRARVCTHWHQAAGLRQRSMISPVANLESDPETTSRIQGQHTLSDILIHLSTLGDNHKLSQRSKYISVVSITTIVEWRKTLSYLRVDLQNINSFNLKILKI